MKKTKAILMALCAVLLVAASVMGTLAYLTSSDTVVNTFTVGKVKITLDEAKVDGNGKALTGDSAERVKANSYKLMPGHEYAKDPTVTVIKGSEESYVRMLVTVSFKSELTDKWRATDLSNIFTGYDANWKRNGDPAVSEDMKSISYEYRYVNTVTPGADKDMKLEPLFTAVEVPGDYTKDEIDFLSGMEIKIVAQAIQADGFADADAAWAAYPKD